MLQIVIVASWTYYGILSMCNLVTGNGRGIDFIMVGTVVLISTYALRKEKDKKCLKS